MIFIGVDDVEIQESGGGTSVVYTMPYRALVVPEIRSGSDFDDDGIKVYATISISGVYDQQLLAETKPSGTDDADNFIRTYAKILPSGTQITMSASSTTNLHLTLFRLPDSVWFYLRRKEIKNYSVHCTLY